MKKSMSKFAAAGLFSLGAVFTGVVVGTGMLDNAIRADIEIVCQPNKRMVSHELSMPDARMEIVRRHKYIPFMGKEVLFSVSYSSLQEREGIPAGSMGAVSFVNSKFYPGAGPLGTLTYTPKSQCVGTYFTAGMDHEVQARFSPS